MFTYKEHGAPLFFIDDKPVYTTFDRDPKLRIPPHRGGKYLQSDEFLEAFNLSKSDARVLREAIQKNVAPEGSLKTKFYEVRRALNRRLFTTIDLHFESLLTTAKSIDGIESIDGIDSIDTSSINRSIFRI